MPARGELGNQTDFGGADIENQKKLFAPSDEGDSPRCGEMSAQRTKGTAPVRGWIGEQNEPRLGERYDKLIFSVSLPPSKRHCVPFCHLRPSRGAQNLPRFGARANFDRFAALASLHPPPAALRRRRPSEGGKVISDFWFHRRRECSCRTLFFGGGKPPPYGSDF